MFEPSSATYNGRDYRGFNNETFLNYLKAHNWGNYLTSIVDPNDLWDRFMDPITTYLDKHCPYIERVVKDRHKCWINDEIMDVVFERESWLSIYRIERLPHQKAAIKACRRKIDKMGKASKFGGITSELDENYANPRKFWKHRVDSPLSDAHWQCKSDPFTLGYKSLNIPLTAFI